MTSHTIWVDGLFLLLPFGIGNYLKNASFVIYLEVPHFINLKYLFFYICKQKVPFWYFSNVPPYFVENLTYWNWNAVLLKIIQVMDFVLQNVQIIHFVGKVWGDVVVIPLVIKGNLSHCPLNPPLPSHRDQDWTLLRSLCFHFSHRNSFLIPNFNHLISR